jgi:hypothetical protein
MKIIRRRQWHRGEAQKKMKKTIGGAENLTALSLSKREEMNSIWRNERKA